MFTGSTDGVSAAFSTPSRSIVLLCCLFLTFISSQPEYKVADPICTFLFSVLVLGTTLPVTKDVFRILMEGKHSIIHIFILLNEYSSWVTGTERHLLFSAGTPQDINFNAVRELLLSVRGVVAAHSLHMWSLNMTHSLLSVHVVTGKINTANLYDT